MALSRAHIVNQTLGKINSISRGIVRRAAPAPPNRNPTNLTLTLTQRDTDYHKNLMFLLWPMCHLSTEFYQTRWLVLFRNPANKQTNKRRWKHHLLAELIIFIIHHYNGHFTSKPGSDGWTLEIRGFGQFSLYRDITIFPVTLWPTVVVAYWNIWANAASGQ